MHLPGGSLGVGPIPPRVDLELYLDGDLEQFTAVEDTLIGIDGWKL